MTKRELGGLATQFQAWARLFPGSGNPDITPDHIIQFFEFRVAELNDEEEF